MKIEVYTKEHCPNCETVKRYLDRRGVEYVECDAAAPASRALLRELGITSAPGVVIRGESSGVDDFLESWGGLRPDRLRHWAGRYLATVDTRLRQENDRGTGGDELLTTVEVAQYLRIRVNTLEQWRSRGKGPAFERVGRRVRYRRREIEKWLKQNGET